MFLLFLWSCETVTCPFESFSVLWRISHLFIHCRTTWERQSQEERREERASWNTFSFTVIRLYSCTDVSNNSCEALWFVQGVNIYNPHVNIILIVTKFQCNGVHPCFPFTRCSPRLLLCKSPASIVTSFLWKFPKNKKRFGSWKTFFFWKRTSVNWFCNTGNELPYWSSLKLRIRRQELFIPSGGAGS